MPNQQAQIIDQIYSRIGDDFDLFSNHADQAAKSVFYDVMALLNQLKTTNNSINVSVENIKIINKIRDKLNYVVNNSEYRDQVGKFIRAYDDLAKLNNKYFAQITSDFAAKEVYNEVKNLAKENVKDALLGSGFKTNITDKLVDIVNQNMSSGAKMDDLVEQVRIFLTDTKQGDGAFSRYAKNYTYDSINKYNASYNQAITSDLELEWYKYVGSLLETSREFCKELINAKKNGMEYIHKSEFDELLKGNINGKQIAINNSTKLPVGMEKGTNVSNLTINRGGYGCGHQFMPVSTASVPQEYKDKLKNKQKGIIAVENNIEQQKQVEQIPFANAKFTGIPMDGNPVSKEDQINFAKAAGIPLDYAGSIKVYYPFKDKKKATVIIEDENIYMYRTLYTDKSEIHNDYFRIKDSQNNPYEGKGFEIFSNQVRQAVEQGYGKLTCDAARGSTFNGYYTWARFGYLPVDPKDSTIVYAIEKFNQEYNTNVKNFGELMATKEGQDAWKKYGDTFEAKFDLKDGSYSRNTFEKYYQERKQKQNK